MARSEGAGCIVVILGLVLTPLIIIGIPIMLYGFSLMSKRDGFWECRRCDARFPRRIRWYELG